MRKLFDNIKTGLSLVTEAYTAATQGATVIDTKGYRDGMLVVAAGDITCTTGDTYRVKVMECDTSTGTFEDTGIYVDFTGASGALAGQNTNKQARISELNLTRKRFLRVDLALTATTTAWEGAGIILLGESYAGPVNTD
ncbi:hypothetical protein E3V39_12495 [Gammaproteobacteria bacterium LSUCC0112]|nr:hypothetical protein E3V39_12495 [Gammaproteobacteria bacterium LSUCC0112]